jgi:hypothetical protein
VTTELQEILTEFAIFRDLHDPQLNGEDADLLATVDGYLRQLAQVTKERDKAESDEHLMRLATKGLLAHSDNLADELRECQADRTAARKELDAWNGLTKEDYDHLHADWYEWQQKALRTERDLATALAKNERLKADKEAIDELANAIGLNTSLYTPERVAAKVKEKLVQVDDRLRRFAEAEADLASLRKRVEEGIEVWIAVDSDGTVSVFTLYEPSWFPEEGCWKTDEGGMAYLDDISGFPHLIEPGKCYQATIFWRPSDEV